MPSLRDTLLFVLIMLVQLVCTVFFVSDSFSAIIGLRTQPISWRVRELIEIGVAITLILGLVLSLVMVRRSLRERRKAERSVKLASGAFHTLMTQQFQQWGLTPAEQDVALFVVKGFSTAEVAAARGTSEGTIKAQTNAIYRKAGVSNRAQLVSLFIEDLMGDGLNIPKISPDPVAHSSPEFPKRQSPALSDASRPN